MDLRAIADTCPFTYTGADFYSLCSDALLNAIKESIDKHNALKKAARLGLEGAHSTSAAAAAAAPQSRHDNDEDDDDDDDEGTSSSRRVNAIPVPGMDPDTGKVEVCQRHFLAARANLVGSLSDADLEKYRQLQAQFKGAAKVAGKKKRVPALDNN